MISGVSIIRALVPVCALLPFALTAMAQQPERGLTVMAGGFTYDYGNDRTAPAFSLRLDQRLARGLLTEVSMSYARPSVGLVNHTNPEPTVRDVASNVLAFSVDVQAELMIAGMQPYVGMGIGLFGRFDPPGGDRFLRPMFAFPLGVRVPISSRVAPRAEARLRFDEHQGGTSATDIEWLVGIRWRFSS